MGRLPDPDWYLDNVLVNAEPGVCERVTRGLVSTWRRWWDAQILGHPYACARLRGFVISTGDLTALGVTRSAMRHAVATGRWTSPLRGVVGLVDLARDDPTPFLLERRNHAVAAAAASLLRPDHVASGRSAAVLHGLPTTRTPRRTELTDPNTTARSDRNACHVFAAGLSPDSMTAWFGVPITTTARTLVDLGRHNRRDAIMAVDAALRERLVFTDEIAGELDAAAGWPYVRQARAVLALGSPQAESAFESITRLALHDSGFPEPVLQLAIGGYRVDFGWPEYRLVLEADGRGKYTDN